MAHPLLENPFVAAEIEAAIQPYVGKLTDEELAWMRDQLATLLADDPEARLSLDGAMPREVDRSGERVRAGVDGAGQTANKTRQVVGEDEKAG